MQALVVQMKRQLTEPFTRLYLQARSGVYVLESLPLLFLAGITRRLMGHSFAPGKELDEYRKALFSRITDLYKKEARDIAEGTYPLSLLEPERPTRHLSRFLKLYLDSIGSHYRRIQKENKSFSKEAKQYLRELPDYYRRNFHFQTDGYLNEESAELYDHQVEILFRGSADVMRRRILPSLRDYIGNNQGEDLKILDVASGSGSASRFIAKTFPLAELTLYDLSYPYLKVAKKRLRDVKRVNFIQGKAEDIPFQDESFDIVLSVFLFHEIPKKVRQEVIKEKLRVLKPGGLFILLDSIQLGDDKPLDAALKQFPQDFHEPFYMDYIKNDLEKEIMAIDESVEISTDCFFLSKRIVFIKK